MQASIPSHIMGATAGRASRLAGSEAIETASNAFAISGAVASVAEMVTPAPSASARRNQSVRRRVPDEEVPQSRGPQEDPDHGGEAQLPADVAAGAWVERQCRQGGEQHGVPA